jgi:hypothetical protein
MLIVSNENLYYSLAVRLILFVEEYDIPDPVLSQKGKQQCATLSEHLQTNQPLSQKVELIVASPLRRTLQTAQLSFPWLISSGIPIIPHANLQGQFHLCI